ncbi:MAG: cytochrome c [Saprospiraceae bacterium]|nr:cytochrome c [Saprospiraceae bacterium]
MKKIFLFLVLGLFVIACGGDKKKKTSTNDGKGYGDTKNVVLNDPLNQEMVANGKAIYELKCAACHKLSAKRVVGPGWAGLTDKRKPEWIMNMITNVDIMLEKDPAAQKLLEECLTRMPNQNVSVKDARDIVEFIFQNDIDQKNK